MLYTKNSDIISLLSFYPPMFDQSIRKNKTGCTTCCQYSSKDGSADRYPVSRTLCSSWKILHMGITSISLPRADLSNPAGNPGKGAFPPCLHARREGNSLFLFRGRSLGCTLSKVANFPFQNMRNTLSFVTSGERANQRLLLVPRPQFRLRPLGVSLVIGVSLWVMIGGLKLALFLGRYINVLFSFEEVIFVVGISTLTAFIFKLVQLFLC